LTIVQNNDSIFSQNWIVVPNHSAMAWLKQAIAKDLGVLDSKKRNNNAPK